MLSEAMFPARREAYAAAHVGEVHVDGIAANPFAADAATVNPYLGSDSLLPFIQTAKVHGKGIFVLVKTSNPLSGEFQDILCGQKKLHEIIAEKDQRVGKLINRQRGIQRPWRRCGGHLPARDSNPQKNYA